MESVSLSTLDEPLPSPHNHPAAFADDHHNDHEDLLKSLLEQFTNLTSLSDVVRTPISSSSYTSTLRSSIQNPRFASKSTPKPLLIVTPEDESQIPPVILWAKNNDIEIRTRSGGHDYEGQSYVSQVPFIILDLINLNEVTVDDVAKTAWVASGATIGSLYYKIAEKSQTLGFPAGICPTVGIGGHFSAGGYGTMLRKYGLAADHVVDARMVDVNGRILDRSSMGEDLFWAIRGGGGASFGVILSWKVKLVDVPKMVTVFTLERTVKQNATQLVHRWQEIAHGFDPDLFIRLVVYPERVDLNNHSIGENGSNLTVCVEFNSIFLGETDRLLPMMQESFPELGLTREDCIEMSWIRSVLYFAGLPIDPPKALIKRTLPNSRHFKAKSDYVQEPIPVSGLEGLWKLFYEQEAGGVYAHGGGGAVLIMTPYGGRMDEISETATPIPYRAGNLYTIQYLIFWGEEEVQDSDKYMSWIGRVYSYMGNYVSRSPRAAYVGYRDVDIGVNNIKVGRTSYEEASVWGLKYFNNNFERLVRIKTRVDPENFFRNEQSIPSLHSW